MSAALHSLIEVHLLWAELHRWSAGNTLCQEYLPAHCLWLGRSGTVEAHSANGEWKTSSGDALLFPMGAAREIRVPKESEWISIGLRAASPGHVDLLRLLPSPISWRADSENGLLLLATQLLEVKSGSGASTLIREALARALFGRLWQRLSEVDLNEAMSSTFPDWFATALYKIRKSPEIKIAEVAHEVGISTSQLRRGFQEFLSTSPQEYSRRRQLDAARQAIEETDLPINRIAHTCGFSSAALFSRAIKNEFGLSPVELRAAAKQPPV